MGDDHRAFLDATLPHIDVVYQVARHAAISGQYPEDLVQETYLRAFAAFGSYRGENTRAWLAAICLNAARSDGRRRRRRPPEVPAQELLDALPMTLRGGARDVADVVIAGLDAQTITRCLAQLPEPQRLCIVLMDVAGYTAREAAEALGCPRGTVLARVHRGRRKLAQLLAEGTGEHTAPLQVGHPVTMTAGGHHIVLRTWRVADIEVAEATSGQPFPMPPGARGTSGGGMAWVAQVGKLSLYCINGRTSELVAAAVPAAELPALAARLPQA